MRIIAVLRTRLSCDLLIVACFMLAAVLGSEGAVKIVLVGTATITCLMDYAVSLQRRSVVYTATIVLAATVLGVLASTSYEYMSPREQPIRIAIGTSVSVGVLLLRRRPCFATSSSHQESDVRSTPIQARGKCGNEDQSA